MPRSLKSQILNTIGKLKNGSITVEMANPPKSFDEINALFLDSMDVLIDIKGVKYSTERLTVTDNMEQPGCHTLKCSEHLRSELKRTVEELTASQAELKKAQSELAKCLYTDCPICYKKVPKQEAVYLKDCGHACCQPCLRRCVANEALENYKNSGPIFPYSYWTCPLCRKQNIGYVLKITRIPEFRHVVLDIECKFHKSVVEEYKKLLDAEGLEPDVRDFEFNEMTKQDILKKFNEVLAIAKNSDVDSVKSSFPQWIWEKLNSNTLSSVHAITALSGGPNVADNGVSERFFNKPYFLGSSDEESNSVKSSEIPSTEYKRSKCRRTTKESNSKLQTKHDNETQSSKD